MMKNYGWIRSVHARAVNITVHPLVINLLGFSSLFSEPNFQAKAQSLFTKYRAVQAGCGVVLVLNVITLGFLTDSLSPLMRVVFFIVLSAIALGVFSAIERRHKVLSQYLVPISEEKLLNLVHQVQDILEKDNALRYVETVRSFRTFCIFDSVLLTCAALSLSRPLNLDRIGVNIP